MRTNSVTAGEVVRVRHESEVLKTNPLGDPHVRDLFVYLPHEYSTGDKRYPVVYSLSGFSGRGKMMLNDNPFVPNLAERMDKLIDEGTVRPMIVVMPDCFTYYGGSQYINSTANGNYGDYLTQELVSYVDANFRTLADRSSRAVMGKSSGGYGALIMGLKHADIFGLVSSISGDAYFEYCYPLDFPSAFKQIKGDPEAFLKAFWSSEKQNRADFGALNTIGMAASYSANGTSFDLPIDLETGEIRRDVWQRWLEHDPVRLVEKYVDNLKSLLLLHLDAGTKDEFNLDVGARILSRKLTDHGIEHIHDEFDDGHFNISYRYDRSLELISNHAVHDLSV